MKKRLDFIDVARGGGVLLMIIGHISHTQILERAIYGFHMPLFFLISGIVYSIPAKEKLFKRLKSYLIPYLVFGIAYTLLDFIVHGISLEPIYSVFWYNTENLPYESALWFLTAMATVQITYTLLAKTIKNNRLLLTVAIALSLAATIITNTTGNLLPYSIQSGLTAIVFLAIGHFFSTKIKTSKATTKSTILAIVTLVISIACFEFLPRYNLRLGIAGLIPISQLLAILASISFIMLAKTIRIAKPALLHYGTNSILYLGLNHLAIKASKTILEKIGLHNKLALITSTTILTLAGLYVAINIIKYIQQRFLRYKTNNKIDKTAKA